MSKVTLGRSMLIAAGVLAATVLGPQSTLAQGYDQQLQAVCKAIGDKLVSQGKATAAVMDFTDLAGQVTFLGRFLAEELSNCLVSGNAGLQIIERLRLGAVLKEQKLGESPIIDPATAKKLGELVGAHAILTGTITPFGDTFRLSVRGLDVGTARVIAAATAEIPKTPALISIAEPEASGRTVDPAVSPEPSVGAPGTPLRTTSAASSFQNDRLRVVVGQLAASSGDAVANLTIENISRDSLRLGIERDSGSAMVALSDNVATNWRCSRAGVTGIQLVFHGNVQSRRLDLAQLTTLGPSERINVIIRCSAPRGSNAASMFSLAVNGVYSAGTASDLKRVSIGLANIRPTVAGK